MDGEALLEFFLRHNDKLWVLLILLAQRSYRVIESGNRGLRFTFGRAGPVLEPGTHVLIPLVQTVKSLPSRARTLDIPNQTLTTHDGIVLHVDCNLVYQVVDPRRALIEIGDLERGMADLTGIAVQAVLGGLSMADLKQTHALDAELDVGGGGHLKIR